jgi:hypothetical protein
VPFSALGFNYVRGMKLMKSLFKLAVASALSLGATSVFAATGAPWSNSSDLLLVVENASTHDTYVLDLGVSVDSLLPTGSLVTNASLNTSLAGINKTVSASSALQSFLAANPAAGDLWTLEGGQWNGSSSTPAGNNTRAPGGGKAIFTSANGTANNANVASKTDGNMNSFLNGLNAEIVPGQGNGAFLGLQSATEATCAACTLSSAEQRYGFWTAIDWSALGSTAVQLFAFTGNNSPGVLQSYILGNATLDANGTLTISGNQASVPLPAAVWLFGSGLLGLFGVARRRVAAA